MRKLLVVISVLLIASFLFTACAPALPRLLKNP
jgi:predicted small secreted protein